MKGHLTILLISIIFIIFSCKKEKTLFQLLSANRTGIDFKNTIIENDSLNVLKFEYIYNGGGVGVGDFNNDGLQDVFFAGNQVSGKLYLNTGNLKFKDITQKSGIQTPHWTTGVALVDINADGWLDIYLCSIHPDINKTAPNQFFINQGLKDGIPVFKEMAAEMGLENHRYSTQAVFFDYDLDHDLDCYILNNALEEYNRNTVRPKNIDGSAHSNDQLYRNDNGRFTNVTKEAGIGIEGWGLGIGTADFNEDGYPDIYCANDFLSNDLLWVNNKNGTFSNKIDNYIKHQSHNSMGVDIADINNDALPDLITLDMMPDDNRRQKSMFPAPNYDYFSMYEYLGYKPQYVRNMLQLNNGNGTFSEIGQMAGIYATDWSWTSLFADFDNDGWCDLLITNGYKKDVTDLDFASFNASVNPFGNTEDRREKFKKSFDALIGVKKSNFIYRNKQDLTFENVTEKWGMKLPSYSNGAAFADFDNDGDLDVVINNIDDEAFFYKNTLINKENTNAHFLRIRLNGIEKNPAAFGAKVWIYYANQKQYAEFTPFRGYLSSVEPVLHFGLNNITKVDSVIVHWSGGQKSVIKNVAANQTLVLKQSDASLKTQPIISTQTTVFEEVANKINLNWQHKENKFIDFKYQVLLPQRYSLNGPPLAVGDVNGDGLEDLYAGGSSGQLSQLFLQQVNGNFKAQDFPKKDSLCEETAALFFDADGDKDLDLYVVHGGYEFDNEDNKYQDCLYLNDGKGRFSVNSKALPPTISSGSCVVANDFDRDGDLDLFVGGRVTPRAYPISPRSYLLQNNNGIFKDITPVSLQNIGMITAAVWADTDGDGWQDLILAGEFMPVQLLKNEQGNFKTGTLIAPSGWWNALSAADFDKDGDVDFVAGNSGLNSRFKATEQEPVCLYAKDYDKNGSIDPILCRYIQGKEHPTHARDALVAQIPSLKKRFLLYADYGKKEFHDIFTKGELQGVLHLKATEMRSCYIENQGSGKFVVRALPNLAQIAPMNAILSEDANNDGHLDILAVGNSFAPEVQTGAYDASKGWILQGDGKGNFTPMPVTKTGFLVDGEGRSLVKIQAKAGNILFIAGCNKGKLKVFERYK